MVIFEGRWWDGCRWQDQDHLLVMYHIVMHASRVKRENDSLLIGLGMLKWKHFQSYTHFLNYAMYLWCYQPHFQESRWDSGKLRRPITRKEREGRRLWTLCLCSVDNRNCPTLKYYRCYSWTMSWRGAGKREGNGKERKGRNCLGCSYLLMTIVTIWMWNILHRLMFWELGPQLSVLWEAVEDSGPGW